MSEKLIHVNSYVRKDGTKVQEHFRGVTKDYVTSEINEKDIILPPDDNYAPIILQGGVSKTDYPEIPQLSKNTEGTIGDIARTVIGATANILNIISAMTKNSNNVDIQTRFDNSFKQIKYAQENSNKLEKKYLEKLATTKNKQEYENLYKSFTKHRELNQKNKHAIAKVEYAVQNKDFNSIAQGLKEIQNNIKNSVEKLKPTIQNTINVVSNSPYKILTKGTKQIVHFNPETDLQPLVEDKMHNNPEMQKQFVGLGMIGESKFNNAPDANELWKMSSGGLNQNSEYLQQNGKLLESTNQLPSDMKNFVQKKLQEQLSVNDSRGIFFRADSNLAKETASSPEIQKFVKDNIFRLYNGENVTGSGYFVSSRNLQLALGHADIYNAHIDTEGNLVAFIIDTYDFNKNDPMWEVRVARNIQEHGLLENYFEIIFIIIPKEEWMKSI